MASLRDICSALFSALRNLWRAFLRRWRVDPAVGTVHFGDFDSVTPLSSDFGFERGTPIDRHYIEQFCSTQRACIRGRVLEIAEDRYTRRFGQERVTRCDTLHVDQAESATETTIIGDLTHLDTVADNSYDCCILTQTLQFIYDMPLAVREVWRVLKPGGMCLATFSGISQISRYDMERWGEYWRITDRAAVKLFGQIFGAGNISISIYGNVYAATAFLQGLATEDVETDKLAVLDPDYQVLIGVRATKAQEV